MARMFWVLIAVRQPEPAALRVRDEHAGPDLVEQRGHRVRIHLGVIRARVRNHLPEELVERRGVARELHAWVECGPHAQPEDSEPELLVGRCRNGDGLRAAGRAAAAWLIEQVHRIAAAKEDASGSPRVRPASSPMSWRTARGRARRPAVALRAFTGT